MASKAKPAPKDLNDVRIPGRFLTDLDSFLNRIHPRILKEAALQAFARKTGPTAGLVTREDLVQATQVLLLAVSVEFEGFLKTRETSHAKKKAS
jgi:hypothetical protein